MRSHRGSRDGFILVYILFFLGALSALLYSRSDRELATARLVRRQALAAQARALAEGAIEDARWRLEAGATPSAEPFDIPEFPDGQAQCRVVDTDAAGRVVLESLGSVREPLLRVRVVASLRLVRAGSERRTVVESWNEKILTPDQ